VQFAPSLIIFSLLCSSILPASNRLEENLVFEEMIQDSYKGLWYPMSNKTLPYEGFKLKEGKLYEENDIGTPFTGWYSQFDSHQKARFLASFMDGKRQGYFAEWDKNRVLRLKGEYFDGEKDGTHIEYNHLGMKISERNYLIGKLHGKSNFWYENGQRKLVSTFEYGLIMEAKGWLSNGEPCPYTKVSEGRGVIFNFEKGFLDQLLQSPQNQEYPSSDSNHSNVLSLGGLGTEP